MASQEAAVIEIHQVCERFHAAIELIGGRWTGAILRAVFTGQHRFAHIRAAVPGLSDTMLAQRLRTLEEHAVLERRVGPAAPGQIEYHLTDKGRELEPVLEAVIAWSHRWIPLPPDPSILSDEPQNPAASESPAAPATAVAPPAAR
ncbi:transcriptional regulator, HxlR family [Actinacidiphila yanglinensis]|uniref:Transcriptional regulator, HxlR family n=1 Tax=Actinacidiphila yanglinensis TaxID=310779 RepID=A0A1H6DB42_9ACTN|nr:helix-turn-helix domain-containing protein [Actinacidiphila yanglinensis]SEG82344.1 transcriptional regulator, HxlR family [Actinacidiphila yanglinensis]